MIRKLRTCGLRSALLLAGLFGMAACSTPSDFSEGVDSFSHAITAADAASQSLYAGAQKAAQNTLLRDLADIDAQKKSVSLDPSCDPDRQNADGTFPAYKTGSCAILVEGVGFGQPTAAPLFAGLTSYAAALSAVVADKTCESLQADSKDLAGSVVSIAQTVGKADVAAQAGAISEIVSVVGCAAIATEQLRILRKATSAADPYVQALVPLISKADGILYDAAATDAYQAARATLVDYARVRGSAAPADQNRAQDDITQLLDQTAAIDKARSRPPAPVIAQIGSLHRKLTDDLNNPTVSLARFQSDAQNFIAEAQALADAAETLAKASAPPPKPGKSR